MLLPAAIVSVALFASVGVILAKALKPMVNDPDLDVRLALLGAVDGLGIVALVHALIFQGEAGRTKLWPPAIFAMFVGLGIKWGGPGQGVHWMLFTGIANGIVASGIALALARLISGAKLTRLKNLFSN